MIVLTSLAVVGVLAAIWLLFSRWMFDIVSIFCVSFVLFYGLRLVVVAAGADGLTPDYLFTSDESAIETTNVLLLGFLVCVAIGLAAGQVANLRVPWLFPAVERRPVAGRYWYVALALTALSTAITAYLMVRHGGFGSMIRASKFDKELAGTFVLRIAPSVGSVVAAAGFIDLRQRASRARDRRLRRRAWLLGGMALLNGFWVYAWGARSQFVVVAAIVLIGLAVFGTAERERNVHRRQLLVRLAVVTLCVGGIIVGLRVGRDLLIGGSVNETISNQSVVRQLSVAANTTSYDAFVLAVRDWPADQPFRDGEDFVNGTIGVVPRSVWADKPDQIIPGAWFRQVYEPEKRNGWPMGVAGEWYLNWGTVGVLVGGVVSGFVLAIAQRTMRRCATNPYAFACTVSIGLLALDLGVGSQFVLRWAGFVLPLIALTYVLRANRSSIDVSDQGSAVPAGSSP